VTDRKCIAANYPVMVPELLKSKPKRTLQLAFSCDEEVGCFGMSCIGSDMQAQSCKAACWA
jgi:putative aminopeptidase FrvX